MGGKEKRKGMVKGDKRGGEGQFSTVYMPPTLERERERERERSVASKL